MNDVNPSTSKAKLYRTSDIYFASYLCSLDFPLVTTESEGAANGSHKVIFVFEMRDEHLRSAKTQFFGGTGTVKARKFVDNIRSLKSMCFSTIAWILLAPCHMCFH
jgi:hypothetical protein